MSTPHMKSIGRWPLRLNFVLILALACLALSPQARATCQQGCLTGNNTVLGEDALFSLATGANNTAIGFNALFSLATGGNTTAIGFKALFNDTDGTDNTAFGTEALFSNTTGDYNTANGDFPLYYNTTGNYNTATGPFALYYNKHGSRNTANGYRALQNSTGDSNIALGFQAGMDLTRGSSNIDIGNRGVAGEANTVRIGTVGSQTNAYVAGIRGATVPTGVPVIVDTSGHLGTTTSSARFKQQIEPMAKASEAILALKPVTFRYKKDLDPKGIPQFGLVAEEVEKVNSDLVARDGQGKPYTVRYDAVNAMLLNEFLKEHREVQELKKQVAALTAGLQKVSAQPQRVRPVADLN